MSQKKWVEKSSSFAEAQQFDDSYYLSLSSKERIETVQFLREEFKKFNKDEKYEVGKRLRRVLKLIKQT